MLDALVTAIALATLASYLWSVRAHFETSARQSGTRLIDVMVLLTAIVCAWMTWTISQSTTIQVCGAAIMLGGLALFWRTIAETKSANLLAAFSDKNPASLVTSGPYALVRHPFYSSYILFWFGFALSSSSYIAITLSVVMVAIYWRAAKQEEEKFMATPMAAEYAAFAKDRKRFIPFIL